MVASLFRGLRKLDLQRLVVMQTSCPHRRPEGVPSDFVVAGIPYWYALSPNTDNGIIQERQPLPARDPVDGTLVFPSHPEFRPNLTPEQVLRAGAFGGTYYRSITSGVSGGRRFPAGVHLEFPAKWFRGLDAEVFVTSDTYRPRVNKHGVKSGNDLAFWERKGWMRAQDPYGWFQWYCRYYLGRRTHDDDRQVSRWIKAIGPKGRWRTFLVGQCIKANKSWNDATASPVTRQTLLHWGYELTESEFDRLAPPIRAGKSVIYMGRAVTPKRTSTDASHTTETTPKKRRQTDNHRKQSKKKR